MFFSPPPRAMPHAGAPSTVVFTVGFGDVFRHYGACGCRSILHAYGETLRALLVATDAATARGCAIIAS